MILILAEEVGNVYFRRKMLHAFPEATNERKMEVFR